jgi:hypothetical protein
MKAFHTLIALHLPRRHADLIVYGKHIVESMTGNAHFPSPTPPLATVTAHIQTLEAAETTSHSHAKGTADARDVPLQQVVTDLHQLGAYVQSVADSNPDQAAAIIASAGFGTHPHGVHAKSDLAAHMGPGGLVILRAIAVGKRAAYEWQVSSDGGKTFAPLPSTTTANTSITGLTLGQTYWFRVRGNVGQSIGDWHEPVSLLVH